MELGGAGAEIERLRSDLAEQAETIERLEAILAIVRKAREEGWYEDNSGWQPIDEALGVVSGEPASPVSR